jgi:hypothetical protein
MRIWLLIALAAVGAAPPQGDLTATYVPVNGAIDMKMKVEVAANGDLRADMGVPGPYLIRHDGRTYFVMPGPAGLVVADVMDMGAVLHEQMNKADPNFCARLAEGAPSPRLVSGGTVMIAGRTGEAFAPEGRSGSPPAVVISRDPALAPLGAAMAAQFRTSMALMGECGSTVPLFVQMQALLDSGAPLEFGPVRLDGVEFGPVDPGRFVLPAAPATRDQVRALMDRSRNLPVRVEVNPPH